VFELIRIGKIVDPNKKARCERHTGFWG